MLYNKLLPILLFTCAMASTASAGVITNVCLDDIQGDGSFSTSAGTANVTAFQLPASGAVRTFSYLVNGLDLAQDGSSNDSAEFFLQVSGNGSSGTSPVQVAGNNFFGVGVGVAGAAEPFAIQPFFSLDFAALAPVVTLGDGQNLLSSTFNGFKGFVTSDLIGDTSVDTSMMPPAELEIGNFEFDPPFVVGNLSLSFDLEVEQADTPVDGTVPEPGSFAIFGTICLVACGRRRIS